VLVVTGEQAVGRALASALRARAFDVRAVDCAEAALSLSAPDVLVSHVALEGLGGFELLEELQRRGARPRAIFLCDRPTVEQCRRALRLGASELLPKPFALADLIAAVEAPRQVPAPEENGFERVASAEVEEIDLALRALLAFLVRQGVQPTARARVAGACSELLDNVQRHAYGDERGTFRLSVELVGDDLALYVEDDGRGFEPGAGSAGGAPAGLARAASLAEQFGVESRPGRGTRVRARFRIWSARFDDTGTVDLSELDYLAPGIARRVLAQLEESALDETLVLSPALAVAVGRMLSGAPLHGTGGGTAGGPCEPGEKTALWS